MSSDNDFLLEANRGQAVSETDDFTPQRYRQMHQHLPAGAKRILDVGCNTGRGGTVLRSLNPALSLTGVDCLPERVAAIDKTVYEKAICSFAAKLPVPNNSFDAVMAGEFLEHVPAGEIGPTLAEFFRVLALHGRLVMTTPNPNYLKNRFRNLSVLSEPSHLTQHYPDCLRHRLRCIGFSNVRIVGSGRMTRYLGQHVPWLALYGSYLIRGDKW